MQHAFDNHHSTLCDLGPGYEKYKYDWNPDTIENYYASMSGKNIYSKIIMGLYKEVFRRKLPEIPKK